MGSSYHMNWTSKSRTRKPSALLSAVGLSCTRLGLCDKVRVTAIGLAVGLGLGLGLGLGFGLGLGLGFGLG